MSRKDLGQRPTVSRDCAARGLVLTCADFKRCSRVLRDSCPSGWKFFVVVLSAWLEYHNGDYLSIALDRKFFMPSTMALRGCAHACAVPACPYRVNVQNGQNWTMARGAVYTPAAANSPISALSTSLHVHVFLSRPLKISLFKCTARSANSVRQLQTICL